MRASGQGAQNALGSETIEVAIVFAAISEFLEIFLTGSNSRKSEQKRETAFGRLSNSIRCFFEFYSLYETIQMWLKTLKHTCWNRQISCLNGASCRTRPLEYFYVKLRSPELHSFLQCPKMSIVT